MKVTLKINVDIDSKTVDSFMHNHDQSIKTFTVSELISSLGCESKEVILTEVGSYACPEYMTDQGYLNMEEVTTNIPKYESGKDLKFPGTLWNAYLK